MRGEYGGREGGSWWRWGGMRGEYGGREGEGAGGDEG